MDAQGYSCVQLAARVGCSKSTIGHLRTGRYGTNPGLAVKIEVMLGVPHGTFFEPDVDDDERRAA
jgi:hypothetical protein